MTKTLSQIKESLDFSTLEVDSYYPSLLGSSVDDLYLSYGENMDGSELSEDELSILTDDLELMFDLFWEITH